MNKEELEYIEELKEDNTVHSYNDKQLGVIRLMVIYRGERFFFQINNKALICIISARDVKLSQKSLKKWDDGSKIEEEERIFLCDLIVKYYEKAYGEMLAII